MDPILIIVFGPLLAAIVAGLGNRMLGNLVAKSLTTGALFVSMFLSWPIFLDYVAGGAETTVVPVFKWVESGALSFDWALRVDALTATMPSATPVKRIVDSPGGRVTVRFSVIIAKPCGQSRFIASCIPRLGSR